MTIKSLTLTNVSVTVDGDQMHVTCPVPEEVREKLREPCWMPKREEEYYSIEDASVIRCINFNESITAEVIALGECFRTIGEAQRELNERKLRAHLRRECERLGGRYKGWNGGVHYSIGNKFGAIRTDALTEFNFDERRSVDEFFRANESQLKEYYRITTGE